MDEATCRKLVSARSGGVCERCGAIRAAGKHHRVKRSQGGRWTPSNIVDLSRARRPTSAPAGE